MQAEIVRLAGELRAVEREIRKVVDQPDVRAGGAGYEAATAQRRPAHHPGRRPEPEPELEPVSGEEPMASSLDRPREHTAALGAVEACAGQLKAELERVRVEPDFLVAGLRVVWRETGAVRRQRGEGRTARAGESGP